jgi:hypothetical protein
MAFMRHNNNSGGGRRHHHNNRHRGPNNNSGNHQPPRDNNGQRRYVNRSNQVFDSNGPDGRVRGTAAQIVDKFTSLARDAQAVGDKVLMQNYFQHAELYQRLLNEITEENAVFEREREAQRAAQAPQPDANAPEAESAPKADNAEGPSSLPAFVQVPIAASAPAEAAAATPKPGAPLRGRAHPRRTPATAASAPADESAGE